MTRAENTRNHITEVALNALAKRGYGGLTVGFIAEAADMSKSGVFARFGGQAALQRAVIDAAAAKFSTHVLDPARDIESAAQGLKQIAKNWTTWLLTDGLGRPCPVFQAAMEGPALTEEAYAHALRTRARFPDYLARLAKRAIEAGEFSGGVDPDRFAFEFDGIGLSTGFGALTRPADWARKQADLAFDALVERARS